MFEEMTYENILGEMLERVPTDVDKREGSIIYDALAPAAFKLAETYFLLSNYIDLFYIGTTVGEYLDRKAMDYGMTRLQATYAIRKIETNAAIDIGTRWGYGDTSYIIIEGIGENTYRARCEQLGTIGNEYSGELENIDNVNGVTAILSDVIVPGQEAEEDEEFRSRIQQFLINPPRDGNVAQYLKWAAEYSGIGAAKVFPLWNGGNTVKIAITDGLFKPANQGLVDDFQEYLDPNSEGLGNGVAPIGSKVTVVSGTQKDINVTADIELVDGYAEPTGVAESISEYLSSVTYKKNSISYMRIGSAILDTSSIAGLSNLTINGATSDIELIGDEIPVLNSLNLSVVSP